MSIDYPPLRLHIAGEWLERGTRRIHVVLNPATGEPLGELPLADTADLERALAAAAEAFVRWRRTTAEARGAVLKKAAALLRERVEKVARIATLEEGKTLAETRIETLASADLLEFYGEECRRSYGRVLVRPSGTRSMVLKEPVGPVAAFAPWNFPVHNPARKLGAPLAAGCPVIMKPAEEAPGSALQVLQALLDAGLPAGVAQIVFGVPDEVSRTLLASPVIRKVSFTGSTAVGRHLMGLATTNCLRTTMELGGHAPVLVLEDADIDMAADLLAMAKCRNAGQVCVSPTRFYVHARVYERFTDAFVSRLRAVRVGDGLDAAHTMGPLANRRRVDAMAELVDDAVRHGAGVRLGGEPLPGRGFFWSPTVLVDVPDEARAMQVEPFGPLALLRRVADVDEALSQANRLPFGLAAYVFTESARTAMRVGDALESGMVGINTVRMAAVDAPFGGVKHSGHGAEDGPEGLDACLVTKTIHHA